MYYLQHIFTLSYNTKDICKSPHVGLGENTARSETILVYNLINLGWLINSLNDQYNPNRVRRTLPFRCEENALPLNIIHHENMPI